MIERIYTFCVIIIIKSEVWTITHFLGLGQETMVSAVHVVEVRPWISHYIPHEIIGVTPIYGLITVKPYQ